MNAALHADALGVLRRWAAPSAGQDALRDRYLAHLAAHPDGMTRGCYPDHLTASTLVLSADLSRALLTLHAKAGQWFQLGGHCEPEDTSLAGAARREVEEESGLTGLLLDPVPLRLDEHVVPFCDPRGGVHHLDVWFLAVAAGDASPVVSAESVDVRWWPVDAMPGPAHAWGDTIALARARRSVDG